MPLLGRKVPFCIPGLRAAASRELGAIGLAVGYIGRVGVGSFLFGQGSFLGGSAWGLLGRDCLGPGLESPGIRNLRFCVHFQGESVQVSLSGRDCNNWGVSGHGSAGADLGNPLGTFG